MKKKDTIGAFVGFVAALAVAACTAAEKAASEVGSRGTEGPSADADRGDVETRSFDFADFKGVGVGGIDKIDIKKGAAFSVTARGYAADLDDLDITLDDEGLSVGRKKKSGWKNNRKPVTVTITMPELDSLAVGGSGSITADEASGDDVDLSIGGSGSINLAKLAAKSASFSIGGSGNIVTAGTADSAEINIGGSGSVNAADLKLTNVEISMAGSGSVAAAASGTADITMTGSGNVNLTGGAKCDVTRMGSGQVNCS